MEDCGTKQNINELFCSNKKLSVTSWPSTNSFQNTGRQVIDNLRTSTIGLEQCIIINADFHLGGV
jgi:hypothetical protein